MSVSPPKESAEAGDATPENSETMDRGEEAQVREAYDFEVKEQDRWLPIANGWSLNSLLQSRPMNCACWFFATLHDDGRVLFPSLVW